MNYKISFSEMNKLAQAAQSVKSKLSLEDMRKQAAHLKNSSVSKTKKQQHQPMVDVVTAPFLN